jgi:hypothetical protein
VYVPGSKGVVVAKQRRGDPTPAEMQLLAQATRDVNREVLLEHGRGEQRPAIVDLAFEMVERRWFETPPTPVVETFKGKQTRVWRFKLTVKGSEAYEAQMARYGVKV